MTEPRPSKPMDTGAREAMSWGTKVHFAYVDDAGNVVLPGCWRIEYDTDAQRQEHERMKSAR